MGTVLMVPYQVSRGLVWKESSDLCLWELRVSKVVWLS